MVQQARSSTATQPAQQPIQVKPFSHSLNTKQETSRLRMMFTYFTTLFSCSCLGSPSVFQGLVRLRRLHFGGPALEELKRGDLSGVTELEELTVHANNLMRFGKDAVFVSELSEYSVCGCSNPLVPGEDIKLWNHLKHYILILKKTWYSPITAGHLSF